MQNRIDLVIGKTNKVVSKVFLISVISVCVTFFCYLVTKIGR